MADLKGRTQAAMQRRTAADKVTKDGGEDSELYAALGYVSKGSRNSGLARRRVNGETKPIEAS